MSVEDITVVYVQETDGKVLRITTTDGDKYYYLEDLEAFLRWRGSIWG